MIFVNQRVRTIGVVLIAFFTIVLCLHGYIERGGLDRYGDMYENYAWGVLWDWGYFKHPPFFGWTAAAWFMLFPHTDFWYYMLSAVNIIVGIIALWFIAGRYGNERFQLVTICLALVMFPLTVLALNFNANSAMIPTWTLLFLVYLRGLEKRRVIDAVLIGLLALSVMLVKYHGAVMLGALMIHALTDKQARGILLSWFGLVAAAVFLIGFAPHLLWLMHNEWGPIRYAQAQGAGSLGEYVRSYIIFLLVPLFYACLSLLIARLHREKGDGHPFFPLEGWRSLKESVEGRALLAWAIFPMVLTIVLGIVDRAALIALWGMPFFPAYAVMLARLIPADNIDRKWPRAVIGAVLYGVFLLVIAPIWRPIELGTFGGIFQLPYVQVSADVDAEWEKLGGGQRPYVGGYYVMTNAYVFYSRFHPVSNGVLHPKPGELSNAYAQQHGAILLCFKGFDCSAPLKELGPDAVPMMRHYIGRDGKTELDVEIWMRKPAKG